MRNGSDFGRCFRKTRSCQSRRDSVIVRRPILPRAGRNGGCRPPDAGWFGYLPSLIAWRAKAIVKKFLQSWLINTLAVLVAVYIVPGIHYRSWLDLFVASLLLGILNAVIRPV